MDPINYAILVISDTASLDPSSDKSVQTLKDVFDAPKTSNVEWKCAYTKIVPDNISDIRKSVKEWATENVALILTTGGTGFAVKDNTPEAIHPLLTKEAPGIVHAMLSASLTITPFAMMSRPVAGVCGSSIVITLPGSPKGAKENLEAILKCLPHACIQVQGGDSRQIHAGGVKKLEKEAGIDKNDQTVHDSKAVSDKQPHTHTHSHDHAHHSHNHGHGHHTPKSHTQGSSNKLNGAVTERYRSSPYPMLSVQEATDIVIANTPCGNIISTAVDENVVGSVLAEDIVAKDPIPAFRASIVDGYAVIHTDRAGTFPVASVAYAAAGKTPLLKPGTIARITTGAPLPPGATAVVMVEDTTLKKKTEDDKEELEVEILTNDITEGENVREVGSDIAEGTVVLKKNDIVSAVGGELGMLASLGRATVQTYQKPIVGVLSTGDELVNHDDPRNLRHGEIRDSNRPTLIAAVKSWGYQVVDLGIANDKPESLEQTLKHALTQADVIITTGGVSMGELDLLKPTIEQSLKGTIHFGRVAMKPGKPTTFATVTSPSSNSSSSPSSTKQTLIFSLPGNPASATVTFHLFVLPCLRRWSGYHPPNEKLPRALVRMTHDVALDSRPEYHRARVVVAKGGDLEATSTGGQRSSRIGSMATANALLCLPSKEEVGDKRTRIPGGDKVEAILIGPLS